MSYTMITSELARNKTKENLSRLNDITMKKMNRIEELKLKQDYQIQNNLNETK